MYGKAHKIRSTVSAIALAASVALIAIPAAQAGNTLVDDYFRDTAATAKPVAQASLSSSDSVNWGKVGIGIIAVCGLLLLVALGMGARQLRHSGRGLGSA